MANFEELHKSIPQAYFSSLALERQKENRPSSISKFYYDPHISKEEQVQFYSDTEVLEVARPQENARIQIAMDEFIISGDESNKAHQMKEFLMDWFRIYVVKITHKEVGQVARGSFEKFYVASHVVESAPWAYVNENVREIGLVRNAFLSGYAERATYSYANLKRERTTEVEQVSQHILKTLRYYADCEFQYEEDTDYLGFLIYTDFDFFKMAGHGISFEYMLSVIEKFSRASYYEVISGSEVKENQSGFSVLDLRNFEDTQRVLDLHMSDFENVYDNVRGNSCPAVTNPDNFKRRNYFDEGIITYDFNDNVGFFFGIDIAGLLRAESRLYRLVKEFIDPAMFAPLTEGTKIEEIKVLRRRVQPVKATNSLGAPYIHIQVWEREEWAKPPVTIVASKDGSTRMATKASPMGHIKEMSFGVSDAEMVRFFSVKDLDAHTLTDGYYQYGISLRVKDGLREALLGAYGAYKEIRSAFDRYYNEIFMSGRYNEATMMVDEDFVIELESRETKPWVDLINAMKDVLRLVGKSDAVGGVSQMNAWVSPRHLNGESMGMFTEVARLIEASMISLIAVPNSPKSFQEGGFSGGMGKDHSIYAEHWFTNQIVDSNFQRKKGLAYMPEGSGDTTGGVLELTVSDFVLEMKDRFALGDSLLGDALPKEHFLPKDILFGGEIINVSADTLNAEMLIYGNNMETEISGGVVATPIWREVNS